jgi:DNA-binding MarR family transcriptional regulator
MTAHPARRFIWAPIASSSSASARLLIARKESAEDLRAHTLMLTTADAVLVPIIAALADENDAEFFGNLPTKERAALERMLKDLVARRGLKWIPIT